MWNTATNRPATNAPNPAIEYWARESWPVYPVEHHDRQQDDRNAQRHGEGVDPLRLLGQHQEDDDAATEQGPVPRHPTVADHRHLFEVVVAQRQRPAAEHEDHDDDEEWQRWCEALLVGESSDQGLADAEREPRCRRDRE